ncbi:MAG TPA: alpha/beta hydrolase, partial [Lactobacillus acetotolerans]|nr:alpha/beta hydrolase [Lactobacillus acetotolerans]
SQIIPDARLVLMPRQTHNSYAVKSLKLLDLMEDFFK